MADVAILYNNEGNDRYDQTAIEYLTSPIKVDFMRVLLSQDSQLYNTVKIRNKTSVGTESNRDISLRNYVSAKNKSNLILDIPINPPLIIDASTYFETVLDAGSELDLILYFDQKEIGELLE